MNAWLVFWTGTLIVVLSVFAVLAVVIAIGGYGDIQALLKSIEERHDGDAS